VHTGVGPVIPLKNSDADDEVEHFQPVAEEVVNLIHSLKPTAETSFYFELCGEIGIAKAMGSILMEKCEELEHAAS